MPGLRRTGGGSPRETLTRLFLLQAPVSLGEAEAALPGLVDRLCVEGLLVRSVGEVAARLDVRPYSDGDRDLWVVSDLTPGLDGAPNRVVTDHVLGISSASTSLAQLTIREPVRRALDLGTGCGVQALHLAAHADRVVATDVNRRALWMTQLNARLNRVANIEVRDGSFFEPLGGETFDQIATNPPFVISPATGERLVYRDSGLPGDRVVEDIVRAAPNHLNDGGWCQILANWVVAGGVPWDERLGSWLDGSCDALRGPARGGRPGDLRRAVAQGRRPAGDTRLRAPLRHLARVVRGTGHRGDRVRLGQPAQDRRRGHPSARGVAVRRRAADRAGDPCLRPRGRGARGARGRRRAAGGEAGRAPRRTAGDARRPRRGDPHTVVLRQQLGLRRARQADTVEAALVGACDGELTVGQILDALARLLDADPAETRETYPPVVRELVVEGFLEPA